MMEERHFAYVGVEVTEKKHFMVGYAKLFLTRPIKLKIQNCYHRLNKSV